MAGMKKRTALAVTVGVWIAGLGSAAALTYDLNRPLYTVNPILQPAVPALDTRSSAVAEPVQSILYVPSVTIVGAARLPRVARRATPPVDISAMHCAAWRDLDIGSGRVQVCQ